MPTLKAIHICNSHKPTLHPKIAKEYVFTNADRQTKIKYDRTTMCINHWTESADFKRITFNKLCSGLTGKCFEMPNASYTNRCLPWKSKTRNTDPTIISGFIRANPQIPTKVYSS